MSLRTDGCRPCGPRSSAKPWREMEGDGRQRVRRVGSVSGAPFVLRMGTVRVDHRPQSDQGHAGPPRPGTRMHVPVGDVATLIEASQTLVEKAEAALDGSMGSLKALHKAEQVRLLVRLAADSGARRGELAALKFGDLHGRVLTIERGVSGDKSVRRRQDRSGD